MTYAYDPLGRLTGSTLAGTTTAYGWDAVPNRTSVQVGAGTAATTAYDAANRPTTGANPTAAYTSDDDGRLTARPGYRTEWDHLGRLTTVRPPTGGSVIASYTYDPLDRLRLVDYGGSNRVRFRYVGLTTGVAQWLDDQSGTVTRHVANGWGGERLSDWTGSGSNLRIYGTNGHHDTTWLASSTGSVSQLNVSRARDGGPMVRDALQSPGKVHIQCPVAGRRVTVRGTVVNGKVYIGTYYIQ